MTKEELIAFVDERKTYMYRMADRLGAANDPIYHVDAEARRMAGNELAAVLEKIKELE